MDFFYSKWFFFFLLFFFLHFSRRKLSFIEKNTGNKIVCNYVSQYGMNSLTTFFRQNASIYQFIYTTLFPKYFCRIDNDAIQSRCMFKTTFVNFKAQKTVSI